MEFVHERKVSPREPLADRTFPSLYMYAYIYTHQWHLLCGMIPMVNLRLRGISTAIHSVDPDLKNILDEIRMITLFIVCHKSKSNGVWASSRCALRIAAKRRWNLLPSYMYVYIIYIYLSSAPLLNERNCMNTPSSSIVRVPARSRFTGSKFNLQVYILIIFPVIDVAFCVSYP